MEILLNNINKIHTTKLGIARIKRNLELETNDVVDWCKNEIKKSKEINRKGKNWYVSCKGFIITINAHSYTIITARKKA
ncbi:MAG: DUF3781 domain-containing protein [Helicobacteraceae bacterium]|jgi:hypothetical protein|nr:DUF3781 domain-containing protein [Helicobacteraceae bacterium]